MGISGLNSISNLEAEIMNIVWEKEKVSVREVHEIMLKKEVMKKKKDFIPYTTIMSTMTLLSEKGLLKQDRSSKTYLYSAAINRNELSKNIIKTVAQKLLNSNSSNLVSSFLGNNKNISLESINKLLEEIK